MAADSRSTRRELALAITDAIVATVSNGTSAIDHPASNPA
jgi:hypothetical protein